ncbi:MAG: PAS domain S-box protein [Negativicutes bacterium]
MQRQRWMPYLISLLVVLLLGIGWIGYRSVDRVVELTVNLYDRPVAVWAAVLRIDANVISMHRSMKDVVLSNSELEIIQHMILVDEAEVKVLADFGLVRDRFVGDPALVEDALRSFLDWRHIRDQVIQLSLEGKQREAAIMTQTIGSRQVEEIENKINALQAVAQQKAQTFLTDAQVLRGKTLWLLFLSIGIAFLLALGISWKVIGLETELQNANRNLENMVAKRTNELAIANENLNAQNEEITAMNEELLAQNEEIKAMNDEVELLNQNLMTMNEELEQRVAERTSDLTAANQELTAQYQEITEIQQSLQRETVLTDALFNSVPGILYLYDDQGCLLRWNKQHEVMTGYTAEELSHMTLLDWYKDDKTTAARIASEVERSYREGFADAEADLQRKDGSKIPMYLTAVPLNMDEKIYFAGIGLDITERRRMTQSLAEQEAHLRALVDTIPDLIWLKNAEGIYLSCNPMFERFFGAKEEEIVGKSDYDFVDKELADFFREHDRMAMAAGGPSVNEEWLTFADNGERILVETVKTPMWDANGRIIGVLGIARDITERKRMENALTESEARYRAVMEQAPEAVVIFNPDTGELLEANARFTERFGYDLLRDGPLTIYQITADTSANIDLFLERVKRERFLMVQRRTLRHKKGSLVQVERSATMVNYRNSSLVALTIRDVSDEVRREQEISRDAQLATRVQNALLTGVKPTEHLDVQTVYAPFSYVGGDLYFMDWRYNGQVLRGYIADATGHGLGTALHTSAMHVLMREVNELDLPLAEQMRWLNQRVGQYFDEGTFAGALGFELDFQARELRWVCAGIPEIWIATKNYRGVVTKPGMYLGVSDTETFDAHALPLDAGDSCYFLTDGLTELLAERQDAPFGDYPAMVEYLQELAQDAACRDDATALCFHVRSLPQSVVYNNDCQRKCFSAVMEIINVAKEK